jgi:DNA-binding CsgD family transcriptional regulator
LHLIGTLQFLKGKIIINCLIKRYNLVIFIHREGVKHQASAESVSYENLHLKPDSEHVSRLISEGYPEWAVIRALGISKNNVSMACDILHEFATKQA